MQELLKISLNNNYWRVLGSHYIYWRVIGLMVSENYWRVISRVLVIGVFVSESYWNEGR